MGTRHTHAALPAAGAHSTCPAVCGKKWTKRAIGMSAPAAQLQFVWRAARYVSLCAKPTPADTTEAAALAQAKADELSKLARLRDQVMEALPGEHKGHFCINQQAVLRMGEEAAAWAAAGGAAGAASAISLATVGEALEVSLLWQPASHTTAAQLRAAWVCLCVQAALRGLGASSFSLTAFLFDRPLGAVHAHKG